MKVPEHRVWNRAGAQQMWKEVWEGGEEAGWGEGGRVGEAWWKMVFSFELLHKGKGRVINIPQTIVVRDEDKGNLYLSNGFFLTSQIPFTSLSLRNYVSAMHYEQFIAKYIKVIGKFGLQISMTHQMQLLAFGGIQNTLFFLHLNHNIQSFLLCSFNRKMST